MSTLLDRKDSVVCIYRTATDSRVYQSSGDVWKSRWPSMAPRPNEPYDFRGRKAILNHP